MRHLIWVVLLLVVNGCCCDLKKESYASVPLTLDDAKKQAKESGSEIAIERRTRSMGSAGGCGHSAVCVILLPIILFDLAFPETWDEVTIMKDGVVTLNASFEKNGTLIHAQHLKDGVVFETRNIELKALGKKVYVDSAKLIERDGGFERVPLPLSSQHDFIAEERKALEKTNDPKKRAAFISEAMIQLEGEGLAFAKERLEAADEPELSRGAVVASGCAHRETFAPLIESARKNAGPWVKLELIECEIEESPAREQALFAAARAGCEPGADLEWLEKFSKKYVGPFADLEVRPRSVTAIESCPAGAHRALFRLWLRQTVESGDLDQLITRDDELELGLTYLDAKIPNQRAAMVKVIAADGKATSSMLHVLQREEVPALEPELLEALATRWVKRTGLFEIGDRQIVLNLFARAAKAKDGATRTKPARVVIMNARNADKDLKHQAMLDAVLVVLGDTSRIPFVSPALKSPISTSEYPSLDEDVAAWALRQEGCTTETLEAAVKSGSKIARCP